VSEKGAQMAGVRQLMSLPQVEAAEDYGFFGPIR
jgi:hypothetical protein